MSLNNMKKYFFDKFNKSKQKFTELRQKTVTRVWNLATRLEKGNKGRRKEK